LPPSKYPNTGDDATDATLYPYDPYEYNSRLSFTYTWKPALPIWNKLNKPPCHNTNTTLIVTSHYHTHHLHTSPHHLEHILTTVSSAKKPENVNDDDELMSILPSDTPEYG